MEETIAVSPVTRIEGHLGVTTCTGGGSAHIALRDRARSEPAANPSPAAPAEHSSWDQHGVSVA